MLRTPAIRYSILMLAFLSVFTLTMPVLLAAFATQVFHLGASGYGLFNSLVAVGAVAGALASTRLTRLRLRIVVLCGTGWAAVLALAAVMPTVQTFGVALVVTGIGSQYFFQSGNPLVQLSTVPEVRGRVISVWVLVVLGGQGIGGPIMGGIVDAARRPRRHAHRGRRARDRRASCSRSCWPGGARSSSRSPPAAPWSRSPPADLALLRLQDARPPRRR